MINNSKIKKAINGDIDAFYDIIENLKVYMYSIAIRYVKNDDDVADAIENTIILVYQNIKSLKKLEYFKTWLTKILINECNKILQSRKNIILIENYEDIDEPCKENFEDSIDIRMYLDKLSNIQKSVVLMYFYEEMSILEIADILKISVGTVKSRLFNAKKKLKKIINREGGAFK